MSRLIVIYISFAINLCFGSGTVINLSQLSGSFKSPSEGQSYPNNLNITWVIESPVKGKTIELYFSEFEIEDSYEAERGACLYDYVKITSGDRILHSFCGSSTLGAPDAPTLERKYHTNSDRMVVNFVTDYSNAPAPPSLSGFYAHYQIINRDECALLETRASTAMEDWESVLYCDHGCVNTPVASSYLCICETGYTLHENKHSCIANCGKSTYTSKTGTISPGTRQDRYSKLSTCQWKIQGQPGFSIYIKFTGNFSIEKHPFEGCVYDWVQYTTHDNNSGPRYCGTNLPNNGDWIDTSSHEITIQFISDLTMESNGFTLKYKFETMQCSNSLKAPQNGHIRLSGNDFEDKAAYSCSNGYKLVGESERVCGADGLWGGFAPLCEIKRCQQPTHLANLKNGVIVTEPIETTYGSQVKTECYIWYELQSGSQVWTCGDDEQWHPENPISNQDNIPICTEICGLKGNAAVLNGSYDFGSAVPRDGAEVAGIGGKISGGQSAKQAEWPWMAFLDSNNQGTIGATSICGGSLISPTVIVTAAHCFDEESVKTRLRIYLGVHNRKNSTDINIQKHFMKTFYIHPDYNERTKANDIAIIILKKAATIGKFVRPICLPHTTQQKELPQNQNSGVVTGWGLTVHTSEFEKSDLASILQEVDIEPKPLNQCKTDFENTKSSIFKTYGVRVLDNMICGGHMQSNYADKLPAQIFPWPRLNSLLRFTQKDSCSGDSGGPYMFKDRTSSRWFLNGIVSFGSTKYCGENTFGIYTNVAHFVGWIGKYI